MFEVNNRVATARSGKLSGDDWQLNTPSILFMDTERFPAPEMAEALLGQTYDEIHTLDKALDLYQNPRIFIEEFTKFREEIGYQAALHLPGIALPNNLALLFYMGADILDSSRSSLLSSENYFLTSDGAWPIEEIGKEECQCSGCAISIYQHNMQALYTELQRVRGHMKRGTLREYVEYKAKTSPKLVEILRRLDSQYYDFQEKRFPVSGANFRAITRLALGRPDIERFRRRVIERYRKPDIPKVLVLLPCSARKPYSDSKSHQFFRDAIRNSGVSMDVHEVIITSPLGIVPRELELYYPAQNYDIPVTGQWFEDEKVMINNLLNKYLEINNYKHIINHLGDENLLDIDASVTTDGGVKSDASLKKLQTTLADITEGSNESWRKRSTQEICSMARFQFGSQAEEMFKDTVVKGRYPKLRIFQGKEQVASISYITGNLVPTLEGSKYLVENDFHTVKIADFQITGNVFAVGVEDADPNIRVGDEVAVVRNGELAACGTARMNGEEMVESNRGEAVRARHRAK